jgi:hypothetical protein
MPWSGVPGDDGRAKSPKLRWLPLLDTLVRMGQFNGKHQRLKALIMDYPEPDTYFTQKPAEAIRVITSKLFKNSEDISLTGPSDPALENFWMLQKMWLRSALVTPGRAPTFAKISKVDSNLPTTPAFLKTWDAAKLPPNLDVQEDLMGPLQSSLRKTTGTVLVQDRDEGNRWDMSLRWQIGLSMKSVICMIMA